MTSERAGSRRSFPRRYAATQRFTLGQPRSFTIAPDGNRVVFIRSQGGDDPLGCLWVLDVDSGEERCLVDPRQIAGAGEDLPPEERARRERARESAGGVVSYATDRAVRRAVVSVGPAAYWIDLVEGTLQQLTDEGPMIAPRLSPDGQRVAFVRDRALWYMELESGRPRRLAGSDDDAIGWGLPDFIAAEEMGRLRGHWWSPDSHRVAAARVDERHVPQWYLGDPVDPATPPRAHRYPAAGTANADVSLHLLDFDGGAVPVRWDREALPYLAAVRWGRHAPLTVVLQSRDQQRLVVATSNDRGEVTTVVDHQQSPWTDLVPGLPQWLPDGRLVHWLDEPDTRRLTVDGVPVTPAGVQVRRLLDADAARLVFTASTDDPTAVVLWTCHVDGSELRPLSPTDGVADGVARGDVTVVTSRAMKKPGAVTEIQAPSGTHVVASVAETPEITVRAHELTLGEHQLRGLLLLPEDQRSDGPLPVLLDPYGGPHAQRALRSHDAHVQSQWFADAGFAVLVVDGRGSPGRGPAWEHAVVGDLATLPLEDQVDALRACAEQHPGQLDLNRVAIKGWSFGGYLAALAVLRRPDVFHAAIAGAPVTDWTLYDTHYTERYLGVDTNAEPYHRSSLLADAARLERPLLLIHGLEDDNVVAAHTLRLSRALLEAGRPHTVLPLSGVTHITPQEVVAENLLHLQLRFLTEALQLADGPHATG